MTYEVPKQRKRKFHLNPTRILLILFFLFSVILPLIKMFVSIGDFDVSSFIHSAQFAKGLKNSLVVTSVSTLFSVLVAFVLAWIIRRTAIRFKGIISLLITLPMLIPSISHGIGLIILFGKNGVLTNLFHLNCHIYGFWGIVIGSVMYSFPVAFLMISDILKYEDKSQYEAADILGISKTRQFFKLTLNYLKKPILSVFFAVFAIIATDYGVPLMIGGSYLTLPVVMYQEVIGLLNFGQGIIIGIVLLIPAVIAFILDVINKEKTQNSYVVQPIEPKKSTVSSILGYTVSILTCLLVVSPIIAFIALTFMTKYPINTTFTVQHILQTFSRSGIQYMINSISISFITALLGSFLAFLCAYQTARVRDRFSKLLHLIAITSLAIPGMVLGLGYVLLFNQSPLYGTLAILIFVNMIHFFASPYLMIYNTMSKLNENLEAVGKTLGISRVRLIKDVIFPSTKNTVFEMFCYFFVNCMMTISAVSFLATTSTRPIALMIPQFEAQMLIECSAFVSLFILLVNLTMKGIVYVLSHKKAHTKKDIHVNKKRI